MKKILSISFAVAVSVFGGQVSMAESSGAGKLTKQDVLGTSQGYILTRAERPQARRSALFAQIKGNMMAKRSTLAKASAVDVDKGWLVFK